MEITEIKNKIPEFVINTGKKLFENGFEAHLVGGSLRDILLNKTPKDYDIASNATPDEVLDIFPKSIPTGAKFGTVLVLVEDKHGETQEIEITTYRSESEYYGGRWPTEVEFTKDINKDLSRRDLTINAMALRIDDELDESDIIDPFGGRSDLVNKIIRAVGNPKKRFQEDALRSLRVCRLAANLQFKLDPDTKEAISSTLTMIDNLSAERIRDELLKLIYNSPQPSYGFELMRETGILEIILPELLEGIEVFQPQYHMDDVYTHSLKALDLAHDSVKVAALFHDIAKPRTRTEDDTGVHFYGHDQLGAEMTKEILTRLKFPKKEILEITNLIRWHMFYFPTMDARHEIYNKNNIKENLKKINLVLIRHGEASTYKNGIKTDEALSEKGIQQSISLQEKLLQLKPIPKKIYSSPVARAKATVLLINKNNDFVIEYQELLSDQNISTTEPSYTIYKNKLKNFLLNKVKDLATNNLSTLVIISHLPILNIIQELLFIPKEKITFIEPGAYKTINVPPNILDHNFLSESDIKKISEEINTAYDNAVIAGWSDGAVRRFIKNVGGPVAIDNLLKLRVADASANKKSQFNPEEIILLSQRVAKLREQDMALKVTDLDINGKDLIENLQIKPGKIIGEILSELLEEVIDDPKLNDREILLTKAKKIFEQKSDKIK